MSRSMLDTAQLRDAFDDTRRRLQTRGSGADASKVHDETGAV